MKTKGLVAQTSGLVLGLVIGLFGCANDARSQQSSAFTYQGQLRDGGTNGSGAYLIITKLFDAATNGNQIGPVITNAPFLVNGLFSLDLDFGAGAFDGNARWLDVTAQHGTNSETLTPRVQIMPAPYALFAAHAGTMASGTIRNPAFFGTTNASALELSVNSERALRIEPTVLLVTNLTESMQEFWFNATFVNTIGGFSGNTVSNGVVGATIAGGGAAEVYEAEDHVTSPNVIGANYSTIGGGARNTVVGLGGTIAGGFANLASGDSATVGGGFANHATDDVSTIAGGEENLASGEAAFVGGGVRNLASGGQSAIVGGKENRAESGGAFVGGGEFNSVTNGFFSAVVGGQGNTASGNQAFVGGGRGNIASGDYSAVVGGESNVASGGFTFAGGGSARATHQGSFVWATGGSGPFGSVANEEFAVRANGGFRLNCGPNSVAILNNTVTINNGGLQVPNGGATFGSGVNAPSFNQTSDRNAKQDFTPVNSREMLARVAELPISTWTFKQDGATRHIGPMAQDFHAAFGVGPDDKHIATVDADGVALAAIQGLHSIVREREAEIVELKKRMETLEKLVLGQQGDRP
jgi:trimeric autotransporter adhesin